MQSLTLSWLIHESPLADIKCVTGKNHLSSLVTSVNVMENSDVLHWMVANELVLTTGFCFVNDEETQIRLIRDLKKLGCAALAIKINRFFSEAPPCMVKEADRLGFPILELPYYCRFSEVSQVVYAKLEADKLGALQNELQVMESLSGAYFKNDSLTRLLEIVSSSIGRSLLLADSSFNLIAYTLTPDLQPACAQQIAPVAADRRLFQIPHLQNDNTVEFLIDGKGVRFHPLDLTSGGFLLIHETGRPLDEQQSSIAAKSVNVLSLAVQRASHASGAVSSGYLNQFVDFLVSDQSKSDDEIRLLCGLYGFDYQCKRICIAVKIPGPLLQRDARAVQTTTELVNRLLAENNCARFLCAKADYLFVFLYCKQGEQNTAAVARAVQVAGLMDGVLSPLCDGHKDEMFCYGIGRCHRRLATIREAFWDSMREIQLADAMHRKRNISSYLEHLPLHAASKLDRTELTQIYGDTVKVLDEFDRVNGAELVETLRAYFQCRFHAAETAKALFLHRNTLAYRLDKIRTLLSMDLSNPHELFSLYLGLCAMDLLRLTDS